MKKIILFFSLLIFSFNVFSQAPDWIWAKHVGGIKSDAATSMVFDASGNIYLTGRFIDTVDFDPGPGVLNLMGAGINTNTFISKSDPQGNLIWAKAFGISLSSAAYAFDVTLDASGNVYATGYNSAPGTVDFDPGPGVFNLPSGAFICKLDNSGNFLWAKTMGPTAGQSNSIKLDAFGNIYIAGSFTFTIDFDPGPGTYNLTVAGLRDIFFAKYDNSGNFIWAHSIGGPASEDCSDMTLDAAGNVIITGAFKDTVDFDPGTGTFDLISAGNSNIFIAKYNTSGNFNWAVAFGDTIVAGFDEAMAVTVDPLGNIYTTGSFSGTADFDPGAGIYNLTSAGGIDIFISKFDGSGNFIEAVKFGGMIDDQGTSITLDPSGNIYTTGYFRGITDFDPGPGIYNLTGGSYATIFISKLDNAGNFAWAKRLSASQNDVGQCVAISPSGHVHLTGLFGSNNLNFGVAYFTNADIPGYTSDFFFAKLDTVITDINETEISNRYINIFPNPATNELTIQNGELKITTIEIFNVLGERVYYSQISPDASGLKSQISVDVSQLPSGLYFLKLLTNNGMVAGRFVKH